MVSLDYIRLKVHLLTDAGLYNAFLAPGSPNELNIDHGLRTQLATRMTRAVGDDTAMLQSLNEVASLFEKAQQSIFKLMSSVCRPHYMLHLNILLIPL